MSDANPVAGSSLSDAANAIAGILEPDASASAPTDDDAGTEQANQVDQGGEAELNEPEQAPSEEADAAAKSKAEADDQSEAQEAEDAEGQELPDTLEGLAAAVGMSAEDFAAHLKVPVKINGQVKHVTLAEARNGFQMDSDYRQKTAELADTRRQFDGLVEQATEKLQSQLSVLNTHLEAARKIVEGEESHLDQLLAEGRTEDYLLAKRNIDARKSFLAQAESDAAKLNQQQQSEGVQRMAEYVAAERAKATEAWPELADPAKRDSVKTGIRSYLKEMGFADSDLSHLVDHRQLLIVRDAMRYRAMEKAKPQTLKKVRLLPKVLKPGAAPNKGEGENEKRAAKINRLRKTGKIRDAASVFEDMLG